MALPCPAFVPLVHRSALRGVATATTASADFSLHGSRPRRPFRREARSPQIRTLAFPTRPPDLRHRALVTRASRSLVRSPCSAPPRIRFLFVGPSVRSPLPSAPASRPAFSALRFPWVLVTKFP